MPNETEPLLLSPLIAAIKVLQKVGSERVKLNSFQICSTFFQTYNEYIEFDKLLFRSNHIL